MTFCGKLHFNSLLLLLTAFGVCEKKPDAKYTSKQSGMCVVEVCGINFSGFYVDVGQGIVHGENENLQAKGKVSEVQIRIMIRMKFADFTARKCH